MSSDAAEKLCATLYCLPFEELYALENCNFPWLMPLIGLSLTPTVDSVHRSIMAVNDEQQRFERIAKIHAWLIPRRIYRPWFLYRLPDVLAKVDRTYTYSSFVNAFTPTGLLGHGFVDTGAALCLTLLVVDEACREPGSAPICFSLWRGLPFVAVHTSGMTGNQANYRSALSFVLGRLDECHCGTSDDLNSAHIEATRQARQSWVQGPEQLRERKPTIYYDKGVDTRTSHLQVRP
ncbi:hypothetical protein HPB52_003832 [Rhipicephalus sanguineus]|uniref:Uncharacterized protein n=1 Tax=Rhipicephalus sanguineus TaxID=34632 RepID=A0A9D4QG47_RHISA|nr:hypothetical protein HPB52_003832 [Rhipicephalus sanguineus]